MYLYFGVVYEFSLILSNVFNKFYVAGASSEFLYNQRTAELTFTSPKKNSSGKYQCSTCFYSTNYLSNLKRHTIIHTGQCPFTCDICGRSFNQKDSLKRHFGIHIRSQTQRYKNETVINLLPKPLYDVQP
ncbi:Zinc finger and BTB domain-containing protein 10, partial [Stegodyphus mimosarum]